jgi:hypothetical protein
MKISLEVKLYETDKRLFENKNIEWDITWESHINFFDYDNGINNLKELINFAVSAAIKESASTIKNEYLKNNNQCQ